MAKQTKKQQALEFLKSRGWVENPNSRTTKYLELTKPGVEYKYFLGSAGAVRRGRTVSQSISVKLKTSAPAPVQEAITELVEADALAETLVDTGDEQSSDPTPASSLQINDTISETESAHSVLNAEPVQLTPEPEKYISVTTSTVQSTDNETLKSSGSLAGKIASAQQHQTREIGTPVVGMVPNEEQESILEVAVQKGLQVLVVGAGAGTGKTATLKMLEQVLPGKGQYTAFNASLVAESKVKFVKADCNTTHSLAFRAIGRHYQHRLGGERVKSYQIARTLGIEPLTITLKSMGKPMEKDSHEWCAAAIAAGYGSDNPPPDGFAPPTDRLKVLQSDFLAGQVMVVIKKFCQSADREIEAKHFGFIDGIDVPGSRNNNGIVQDYLLPFCRKAWDDLTSVKGELPFSHDCYVKIWQLGEGKDCPVIAADYILLDEAQDTAPVFLDVLKQQTHALLVLVGDDNQQIYEWRGAVNAMSSFKGAPRRLLSQSYRFGQVIADVANTVLATLDEPTDLVMRGNPAIPSRVDVVAEPRCYLYRTNAGAVSRVMLAVAAKKRPHLIGGGDETVKWCQAAMDLQSRRGTRHPELCCFDSWGEVVEYSKTDEGADMRLMVKLIEQFGAEKIRDALRDMPKEENADLVVSTAHKSKGREWDTVRLGPDFPTANKMTDPDRRLLYVAATRAKLVLDVSECPPFCGGIERSGGNMGGDESGSYGKGEFIPGLEITYTQPMPTEEALAEYIAGKRRAKNENYAKAYGAEAKPQPPLEEKTNGNGRNGVPTDVFTWAKGYDGKWNVRGPKDAKPGDKVRVEKRSGAVSYETIREVVKRYEDAWIYSV